MLIAEYTGKRIYKNKLIIVFKHLVCIKMYGVDWIVKLNLKWLLQTNMLDESSQD